MNAIVTAGGIPSPEDPLHTYTNGRPKALLEIGHQPMIQWVMDALGRSDSVRNVIVVGLSETVPLHCERPMFMLPGEGSMLGSIRAGINFLLKIEPSAERFLLVSSDIPGLTGAAIDWVVQSTSQTEHDLYFFAIPRDVMNVAYPGCKRTFIPLKDMAVCAGDVFVGKTSLLNLKNNLGDKIIEARKNPLKEAMLFGLGAWLRLIFHQMHLEDASELLSWKLGIKTRGILCPYPEIGMDVDKPFQFELMRKTLGELVPAGCV